MKREEREFMDGWQFAFVNEEAAFKEVVLPHDWAVDAEVREDAERGADQGYRDRWGIGWYRKKFSFAGIQEKVRYYLDFGGIFENSAIWVNGEMLGGHRYGYTPFRLDVTEALQAGENEILIRVDNTASPADRWYSGCGIYRTVKWIEVNEKHLNREDATVRTKLTQNGADVLVRIEANTDAVIKAVLFFTDTPENPVISEVAHADGQTTEQAIAQTIGKSGEWLTLPVENPKLWSAEAPFCYELSLSLLENGREVDKIAFKIGIREVEFLPGKGLLINGKETLLKGVCLHQDVGVRGTAARKELWMKRLEALKEMGCNAIRAAHHMHSEEFMDLCDEMGFYVYEECFDKWTGGLYGRYFEKDWQEDAGAMVCRDRNRPSVIIWGVGNEVENQGQASMLKILQKLTDYVHSLDESRPVCYAMNPHFKRESNVDIREVKDIQKFVDEVSDTEIYDNEERVERIRRIGEIVDIIGCNYQEQWYPMIHEAMPDKLILGTEIYQYFSGHPDQMQNFTEENPSLVPSRYPWCIGGMIWTGIDYFGESMGYPSKGWSGAMIRTNGERRANYYTLQSYWSDKPMIHFAVLDTSFGDEMIKEHWDAPMYEEHWDFPWLRRGLIPYRIATNCEEAALYLNGKKLYVKRPEDFPNRMITGYLPWQSGEVKAVGYRNGEAVAVCVVKTPKPAVELVFTLPGKKEELPGIYEISSEDGLNETEVCKALPDKDADILKNRADSQRKAGYELLLTVRAADEQGVFNMRSKAEICFETEGAAEIVGVDNGDLTESTPCRSREIMLYRGAASVLLRFTENSGEVRLRALADGLGVGEVTLVY